MKFAVGLVGMFTIGNVKVIPNVSGNFNRGDQVGIVKAGAALQQHLSHADVVTRQVPQQRLGRVVHAR